MGGYLVGWCAVLGVAALAGYGRSLAGLTRAQRAVRATGRIVRVREPRHGGSRRGGVSVVVAYTDPATGGEVVVTNEGERGDVITAAWPGREIGVSHPPGRPHAYRFTTAPGEPGRGLGWPNFAVFLIYAGVVVYLAVERAWPWALVGFCGLWALFGLAYVPGSVRASRRRAARLAAMETVPGKVVAVLKDVSDDSEGGTMTTITPVVSFTTADGTTVTAHCESGIPRPKDAYGRDVLVHYTPGDPADFTLDLAGERRAERREVPFVLLALAVLVGAAVTGAVLLV
ncbi:DUF3592 domain-containing protein [Streptomyces roseirectus]|uniref:DUF3592 domain-containing protein n=1 Tax=Streptomyces roseirectus TaxID=2768066 RepID=A0A7H0I782_9ACTN|nr:DUF3592 domain-containing protein [Streptomyces roseirectus]QNP68648.1 DUF3592 domain-containing protein [Streptomyces roseirectus]